VRLRYKGGRCRLEGYGGVEDARAVDVEAGAGLVRDPCQGGRGAGRDGRAAAAVVRVLQTDEGRARAVDVRRAHQPPHLVWVDEAAVVVARLAQLDAADPGRAGDLVVQYVGLAAHDGFVAALAVRQQRDEVGHGAAGDEHGRLLAHPVGGHLLQALDGGVVAEDVVSDFGPEHRLAHRRRGMRDRVAAQVDYLHFGRRHSGGLTAQSVRQGSSPRMALRSSFSSSRSSSERTTRQVHSPAPSDRTRSSIACQTPDSTRVLTDRGQEKATMRSGAGKRGRSRRRSRKRSSALRTRSTTRIRGPSEPAVRVSTRRRLSKCWNMITKTSAAPITFSTSWTSIPYLFSTVQAHSRKGRIAGQESSGV